MTHNPLTLPKGDLVDFHRQLPDALGGTRSEAASS